MTYLICYAAVICGLVLFREFRQRSTVNRFMLADREVGGLIGSMSIAASWIWAPAIFISTQTGFKWGFSGLVWFVLPNMLALVIFAPLAAKVRQRLPDGYNYIESLASTDRSFMVTQLCLQLLMQVVIFAIQLVAGAELLSQLTGADYRWMIIGMALTPLSYSLFSGLRAGVFTDAIQYVVIALVATAIVLCFPIEITRVDLHSFNPFGTSVLYDFGISSALGLLVAIFADHQQWQRAFAAKSGQVKTTFYKAALFHGFVTTSLGVFGCLIFSVGFTPEHSEMVGLEFIRANYAPVFVSLFVIMAICALVSTLDSGLCAFSSLAMKQLGKGVPSLREGRIWMVMLATFGLTVAFCRPPLITLWFIGSTIRLATFVPTVMSVLVERSATRSFTVAVLVGLVCGGSVFAYALSINDSYLRTIGMILTLSLSAMIALGSCLFRFAPHFSWPAKQPRSC